MKRTVPSNSSIPPLKFTKEEPRGNRTLIPQANKPKAPNTPSYGTLNGYNTNARNNTNNNGNYYPQASINSSGSATNVGDFFSPQRQEEERITPQQTTTQRQIRNVNITTCTVSIDMILNEVIERVPNKPHLGFMFKETKFPLSYVELYGTASSIRVLIGFSSATLVKIVSEPDSNTTRCLVQVRDDSTSQQMFVELGVPELTLNIKQTYHWIGHLGLSEADQSTKLLRCVWARVITANEFKQGREDLRLTFTKLAHSTEQ